MTTLVGSRAKPNFPVGGYAGAGVLNTAWGTYTLGVNPTAADIAQLCKLPAGATVLGGWVRAPDIDTGSGVLDFDIGWPANGGSGASDAAASAGFGNFGALNGTAVTNYLPEGGILLPLHGTLANGPVTFTQETTLQAVFNVAANAGGTGTITLVVLYVVN